MERCTLCPGKNNCVPPSGPQECNGYMFIGEAPGYEEDRKGRPFVGKTGMEVDMTYLPLGGFRRRDAYFTNAIKCLPTGAKGKIELKNTKDKELLESCAQAHLYREIEEMTPKLLIPMGAFACYAIDPDINLDLHHGMPIETRMGMAFPMWHPSGGIHEPKKMLQIRTDWIRLKRYIGGTLNMPYDEFPTPDYAEIECVGDLKSLDPTQAIGCDTESSRSSGPHCLTFSTFEGTGRLIRANRPDLLREFQAYLNRWESEIIFHNWLYDRGVVMEMGLRFPDRLIRDSMVSSFHLGNLPQGLKALAFRELGMTMQDFEDLVKPYSSILAMDYLKQAYLVDWPKPEPVEEMGKDGLLKMKQPQGMNTKIKRFFTDLSKDPDKDIYDAWDNWKLSHALIEDTCGEFPYMDIAHVPFDKMLHYACRDADATLRLWPILKRMKVAANAGGMQENWSKI